MGCIGSKDRKFVVSIKLFSYTTLVLFDLIAFFMYFLGVIQVLYFGVLCQQTTVGLSGGLFFIKELESDILGPLIVLPFFSKILLDFGGTKSIPGQCCNIISTEHNNMVFVYQIINSI